MRGVLKFLLTLIVGIALIWLGIWWYAESRLQSGFTAWADGVAADGGKVSYDAIHRGTSLLNAAITVENLTLSVPAGASGTVAIGLPSVTLRIAAFNPLVFHTDLPNKISIDIGQHLDLVCSAGSISNAEYLDPDELFGHETPIRGGDFSAGDVDILASAGSLLVLHIDKIGYHVDVNPKAGPGATAAATQLTLDGLRVSPLIARLTALPFAGRVTRLAFAMRVSGPVPPGLKQTLRQIGAARGDVLAQRKLAVPLIHDWASQGGNGDESLDLVLGPSTAHADIALKFDANIQPEGNADLTANHLDQFTAAVADAYPALQDDIARLEAELTPYLTSSATGGQTLTLHVAYGRPEIVVNGHKVEDMPPLDWNAAENPPAPAAPEPAAPAPAAPAQTAPANP